MSLSSFREPSERSKSEIFEELGRVFARAAVAEFLAGTLSPLAPDVECADEETA